jgi:CMP/dCMP kinase
MEVDIIAVDGEAASGKSACKALAQQLGYNYLETGLLYRAVTVLTQRLGLNPADHQRVASGLSENIERLKFDGNNISLDDELIEARHIHSSLVSDIVPLIAEQLAVRELVLPLQRAFARNGQAVVEGRDIGSVVFPEAWTKIYLTASPRVRAIRRFHQYRASGNLIITLPEVEQKLSERDHRDKTRPHSPLMCVPEAVIIDTSELTIKQVVEKMMGACTRSCVA